MYIYSPLPIPAADNVLTPVGIRTLSAPRYGEKCMNGKSWIWFKDMGQPVSLLAHLGDLPLFQETPGYSGRVGNNGAFICKCCIYILITYTKCYGKGEQHALFCQSRPTFKAIHDCKCGLLDGWHLWLGAICAHRLLRSKSGIDSNNINYISSYLCTFELSSKTLGITNVPWKLVTGYTGFASKRPWTLITNMQR